MRVLVLARTYLPIVGGLEIRVGQLAEAWSRQGLDVVVATRTPGEPQELPFRVLRDPGMLQLLREVREADLVYQPNLSLRELWPLSLVAKPWAVSHHSWYTRSDGSITLPDRLKRSLSRRADASIAVSQALANDLGPETIVIPNPYRDEIFFPRPEIPRDRDLVFVGRLVSDKGLNVLIDALALLAESDQRPRLTVIGSGPERVELEAAVGRLRLEQQVRFMGQLESEALACEMARHEILVVPSLYKEPFGIVALEGLACGCVAIGSDGGGLPEAIGECGLTFPNGDASILAARITQLLTSESLRLRLRKGAPDHLQKFRSQTVVAQYLAIFRRLTGNGG